MVAEIDERIAEKERASSIEAAHACAFLLDETTVWHQILQRKSGEGSGFTTEWMQTMVVDPIVNGGKPVDLGMAGANGGNPVGLAIGVMVNAIQVLVLHHRGKAERRVCHHVNRDRLQAAVEQSTSTRQASDRVGIGTGAFLRACRREGIDVPFAGRVHPGLRRGGKPYESCEYVSAMEKIKVEAQ